MNNETIELEATTEAANPLEPIVRQHYGYGSSGLGWLSVECSGNVYQIVYCNSMLSGKGYKTKSHPIMIRLIKGFYGQVNNGEPFVQLVSLDGGFDGALSFLLELLGNSG